jgi:hypothetical protein
MCSACASAKPADLHEMRAARLGSAPTPLRPDRAPRALERAVQTHRGCITSIDLESTSDR